MRNDEAVLQDIKTEMGIEYHAKGNVYYLKVSERNYLRVAKYLRKHGSFRLLAVSAVDWVERGNFEVYFIVSKLRGNMYFKFATEIARDNPRVPSLSELWPNAAAHERETWELFGIFFEGNEVLKPLFLEDYVGLPPFRKDFDWREYVEKTFFTK